METRVCLTSERLRGFREDGYLVVRGLFPPGGLGSCSTTSWGCMREADTRLLRALDAAAYTDAVVRLEGRLPATLLIINGTPRDGVVIRLDHDAGERGIVVRDCRGRVELAAGPQDLEIPAAGVAVVR